MRIYGIPRISNPYIGRDIARHRGVVRLAPIWSAGLNELFHPESISATAGHEVKGIRARIVALNDLFSAHSGIQ